MAEIDKQVLLQAANEARGLAIDAVQTCHSGHLGLPLGAAEIGAFLFGKALQFHPDMPSWINRDRFVLSAGHGSLFLYTWLHLSGYDLSLEELRNFRKMHSKTPGHPENFLTPGVEATTGPLGQGIGNAVGMAVAAKMASAHLNTPEHTILDYRVVCLAGDGCIQEGVAAEASAFAGHFGLDNLILIYDDNGVTLDALADKSQSEDTAQRYKAYGFDVHTVDGHDLEALEKAFKQARATKSKKPQLIMAKTVIGKGISEIAGTQQAHGEKGASFGDQARPGLGLPEERFFVSDAVRDAFSKRKEHHISTYQNWLQTFDAWRDAQPEKAAPLEQADKKESADKLLESIPVFSETGPQATRKSSSVVLQSLASVEPLLISGSADLHSSTLNYIESDTDFSQDQPSGRNIRFGIREHAMGAILNGIAYDGLFRASGATFATFSDYMRPAIRLAALARLPVFYFFTHDSIGVGEDGPTHQPVEITSSLRLIPNLDVIRPADPEETAGALVAALDRCDGPTALILSRQNVPNLESIPVETRREGVLKGAYTAYQEQGPLDIILLATGSELQLAIKAAEQFGSGVRVVSLPCWERFQRQSEAYQETVLPKQCRKRIAIEAGVTSAWHQYVGLDGKVIGIDRFGLSAPGDQVQKALGMTVEHIIETMQTL